MSALASAISQAFSDSEPVLEETTEIKFPKPIAQNDMEARQQLAEFIAKNPQNYKICCGCDAVVKEHVGVCPQCLAYRFEDDPRTVVAHAFHLAKTMPTNIF